MNLSKNESQFPVPATAASYYKYFEYTCIHYSMGAIWWRTGDGGDNGTLFDPQGTKYVMSAPLFHPNLSIYY